MKILVTGANGQVGQEFILGDLADRYNVEIIGYDKSSLNIADLTSVQTVLNKEKPDVVINTAAYTAVDKAEDDVELAYKVNEVGPKNLAEVCNSLQIPIIHISTDYVFDGEKDSPYQESDLPNPTGIYGKSKLAGEIAIQQANPMHYIVRVAWVFGAYGNNFIKTMLRVGEQRSELSVVNDQYGGPTWAQDIAETLIKIAVKAKADTSADYGIYHYTGAPKTTWHNFALDIFEQAYNQQQISTKPKVLAISTQEYPTPAKRPNNSVLNCSKIKQNFNIEQSNWQVGLSNVLNAWKK